MYLSLERDREADDRHRHMAEVPTPPGVPAYGATEQEAVARARALARRALADQPERGAL